MPRKSLVNDLRERDESANRAKSNGPPQLAAGDLPDEKRGDAWEPPEDRLDAVSRVSDGALDYNPFPLKALPEPARGYIDACSAAIDCDPSFVAIPVLTTLAAAVGNTRRIRLKRGWTEPAILWAGIVGESGTTKSPAIDHAKEFPRRRQVQAMARYDDAVKEYTIADLKYQAELAVWKRKGKGNPPEKPEPPTLQRCIVDDATIEAVAPILLANWRGVLILRDELAGWLGGFDRYAKKGGGEAAKWIEMHGGRPVIIDRKTGIPRTIFIPRAAVSLCGGIQPGILRRLIGQEHRDSGLLARLLISFPPRRPRKWTDAEPAEELTDRMSSVYDRLWELAPTTDRDGEAAPVVLDLSPDAKRAYVDFVNEHGQEQYTLEGDLAAAWSKLEGYAPRLALVHHLIRWADDLTSVDNKIDEVSMRAGIELVRWFGHEDRRIYSALAESPEQKGRRELLDLIRRHGGPITARELQRASRCYATTDTANAALEQLARDGKGYWKPLEPSPQGGRPGRVFYLA